MTKLTIEQRRKRAELRAKALRDFTNRQFKHADLLEIFGRAFKAKLAGGVQVGKHTRGRSCDCLTPHSAGTKLIRRFIRRGNTENTAMRLTYAARTGHQYGQSEEV